MNSINLSEIGAKEGYLTKALAILATERKFEKSLLQTEIEKLIDDIPGMDDAQFKIELRKEVAAGGAGASEHDDRAGDTHDLADGDDDAED